MTFYKEIIDYVITIGMRISLYFHYLLLLAMPPSDHILKATLPATFHCRKLLLMLHVM